MRLRLALLLFFGLTMAGHAATISYADAMTQLAASCGADIKKICKGLNLGGGRIKNCLQKNAAQVSQPCNATLASVITSIQAREKAQASVTSVCKNDANRLCNGVKLGDAHMLTCLVKASGAVSRKCNDAITNAGWR
jgi:hypothetical protein